MVSSKGQLGRGLRFIVDAHPSGKGPGRVILKSVSERHLLRKGGTEYH